MQYVLAACVKHPIELRGVLVPHSDVPLSPSTSSFLAAKNNLLIPRYKPRTHTLTFPKGCPQSTTTVSRAFNRASPPDTCNRRAISFEDSGRGICRSSRELFPTRPASSSQELFPTRPASSSRELFPTRPASSSRELFPTRPAGHEQLYTNVKPYGWGSAPWNASTAGTCQSSL